MTDAQTLDDRRRFKELWKELLYARLLPPLVIVLVASIVLAMLGSDAETREGAFYMLLTCGLLAPVSPAIAKRGRWASPWVFVACVTAFMSSGLAVVALGSPVADAVVAVGSVFAAAGLAEGLIERSIATTYCGLLGGGAGGGALGTLAVVLNRMPPREVKVMSMAVILIGGQLTVGLSLALGRYIRDLPKRKVDPGAGEG